MLGIKSAHYTSPGQNTQRLPCIIATSIMAGELSLLSALAAGHLVHAHLVHNRSQANTPTSSRPVTPGLIASDIVLEQKMAEKNLGPLNRFSRIHYRRHLYGREVYLAKDSYVWLILALVPAGKPSTGAGMGLRSSYPQSNPYLCWRVRVFAGYGYGYGH